MSSVDEIWNTEEGGLSEQRLMAYLEGRLDAEEQRRIECLLSGEDMESDAIEGLKQLHSEITARSVKKLNARLRRFTHRKKRRTPQLPEHKWTWLAIILVLFLCVLGYWVLRQERI